MSHAHDYLPDTPQDYATSLLSELLRAVWRDPAAVPSEVPYRFDQIDEQGAREHAVDLLTDLSTPHLRLIGAAARELNEAAFEAHLHRNGQSRFRTPYDDEEAREFPTIPSPGDSLVDYGERKITFRGSEIVGHLFGPPDAMSVWRDPAPEPWQQADGFTPGASWLTEAETTRLAYNIQPHPFENPDGYFSPSCTYMVMRADFGEDCGLPADHPIHHVQGDS